MIAALVGLVFVGLGVLGILHWAPEFSIVVKGLVPISLILGGLMGIFAGVSSLQARRAKDHGKK